MWYDYVTYWQLWHVQGQEKMSKSDPNSAIFMEDSASEVKTKIKKAFCPPEQVLSDKHPSPLVLPSCFVSSKLPLQQSDEDSGRKVLLLSSATALRLHASTVSNCIMLHTDSVATDQLRSGSEGFFALLSKAPWAHALTNVPVIHIQHATIYSFRQHQEGLLLSWSRYCFHCLLWLVTV